MGMLVRGGMVVTNDSSHRTYDPGAVYILDDKIAWVGPLDSAAQFTHDRVVEVIDTPRSIAMPGFVNAHMHSNECFERGAYDNLPLDLWAIRSYPPWGLPRLTERDHYLRTMLCAVESIRSGVTTIQDDLLFSTPVPELIDGAAKAYCDAGMRAVLTVTMADKRFLDCLPYCREIVSEKLAMWLDKLPEVRPNDLIELFWRHFNRWNGFDNKIRIIPAPVGLQWCSDALLTLVSDISDTHNLPIHTHVLESKIQAVLARQLYRKSAVEHMNEIGILSQRLSINHGIWLTDRDIDILGDRKCSVTHNPLSNLKLGSGLCPVRKLLSAGVNVALGTDGAATSDTPNLIEAMRAASLIHKISTHRFEEWISADDVFRMATHGGAISTGLHSEIGSIEVGKKADLVLLDRNAWSFIPVNNVIRQVAFSATSEVVHTSIINGRVVMKDRRFLLFDEGAVKAEVMEAAERFQRESKPKMVAVARQLEPYVRAVYDKAMEEEIAGDGFAVHRV